MCRFLHPQIFCNDPSHPLTIYAQLICYHSNSKTVITPPFFSYMLNIFICSACGCPPTFGIVFHILFSILSHSKCRVTLCYHHRFLQATLCFSCSFSKIDKKFWLIQCLILIILTEKEKTAKNSLILSNFNKMVIKKVPWQKKTVKKDMVVTE